MAKTRARKKPGKIDTGGERIALPPDTRAWLSIRQIAQALDMSERHVREMISEKKFPEADVKPGENDNRGPLGRAARWKVETYNAWCDTLTPGA